MSGNGVYQDLEFFRFAASKKKKNTPYMYWGYLPMAFISLGCPFLLNGLPPSVVLTPPRNG